MTLRVRAAAAKAAIKRESTKGISTTIRKRTESKAYTAKAKITFSHFPDKNSL